MFCNGVASVSLCQAFGIFGRLFATVKVDVQTDPLGQTVQANGVNGTLMKTPARVNTKLTNVQPIK